MITLSNTLQNCVQNLKLGLLKSMLHLLSLILEVWCIVLYYTDQLYQKILPYSSIICGLIIHMCFVGDEVTLCLFNYGVGSFGYSCKVVKGSAEMPR